MSAILIVPHFKGQILLNLPAIQNGTPWLPFRHLGIASAVPYAIYFFLSIETPIFAAEDSDAPAQNLPKGLLFSITTMVLTAIMILTLLSGSTFNVQEIAHASAPFVPALKTALGDSTLIYFIPLIGSITGFQPVIYASSRTIFSMARMGYLPSKLAHVDHARKTPMAAVIFVCCAVFIISFISLWVPAQDHIVEVLISMAALGALLSYLFVFASYLKFHADYGHIHRPFLSPFSRHRCHCRPADDADQSGAYACLCA